MMKIKQQDKTFTVHLRNHSVVLICAFLMTLVSRPVDANAQYQKDYINAVLPWAQQAHANYGVPISVAIAQSAYESGWYLSNKPANNFFNITYLYAGCDPYTTGPYVVNKRTWRAYNNGGDAFLGYGFFLTNDPNFTGVSGAKIDCRPDRSDAFQFLHDIAFDGFDGGPNADNSVKQGYYDTISSIINSNNLTQYDQLGGSDTEIWVDGANTTSGQDGSVGNPYNTIAAAVNRANATQAVLIHIKPFWYKEKIGTSKHIHFVTNGSGTVRIGG